ncbi:hypothetical protein HKX48_003812 [Thoreauomyces humboldtii]|nr:hypothetical protein HKX48_003812 [Thoreauomyces humboldtii]
MSSSATSHPRPWAAPRPARCACQSIISAPHWEKLPTVTIPLTSNPPQSPAPPHLDPQLSTPPSRSPHLLRKRHNARKHQGTPRSSAPSVAPSSSCAHAAAGGSTIATLCDADRQRLAALVTQLALAQEQKRELTGELTTLKQGLVGVTQELEKSNAEKGSVLTRNKAITRRLTKAETLLRQYEVEIDSAKAEVQHLQDGAGGPPSAEVKPASKDPPENNVQDLQVQTLVKLQVSSVPLIR